MAQDTPGNDPEVYFSVRLLRSFHRKLKLFAVQEDMSMAEIVRLALEKFIAERESGRKPKR